MTRLTYFEPLTAGHCAFWAGIVLQAAARDPRVEHLRLVAGAELAARLAPVTAAHGIRVEILPQDELAQLSGGGLLRRGRAQWSKARALLAAEGGQLFLPFFDHALYGAILDRRPVNGQVSGIIFRPPNGWNLPATARSRLDAVRRWTSYAAARRPALRALFTLDEWASAQPIARRLGLLRFSPDPAPDLSLLAAAGPPRRGSRRVALLFGALTRRKGIFRLLEAVAHLAPETRAALEIRFVGRLDAEDRAAFLTALSETRAAFPESLLTLVDRYVPDQELACEIAGCDVVLAPYQNHVGSSGVAYWSAAAGKPLITQNTGFIGWQAGAHGLGIAIDATDARALARALSAPVVAPATAQAFLAEHRPETFARAILNGVT